jgi:hypothetical protein
MPARGAWPWARRSPLAGQTPEEQYRAIRWGRRPREHLVLDVPALRRAQDLVCLGRLRALYLALDDDHDEVLTALRPYPYLCVGAADNRLYVGGGATGAMARRRLWGQPGSRRTIRQVDYDSVKGRTRAYFYHDHERPFPRLEVLPSGYPAYRGGGYKVGADGIIG